VEKSLEKDRPGVVLGVSKCRDQRAVGMVTSCSPSKSRIRRLVSPWVTIS